MQLAALKILIATLCFKIDTFAMFSIKMGIFKQLNENENYNISFLNYH